MTIEPIKTLLTKCNSSEHQKLVATKLFCASKLEDGRGSELGSGDSTKGRVAKNSETSRSHSNTTWSGMNGQLRKSLFAGLHSSPRFRIFTCPYTRFARDSFVGSVKRSTGRLRSPSRRSAWTATGLLFRRLLAGRAEAWRPKRAWRRGGRFLAIGERELSSKSEKWEVRVRIGTCVCMSEYKSCEREMWAGINSLMGWWRGKLWVDGFDPRALYLCVFSLRV